MGFIENNKAACIISVLINALFLLAVKDCGIDRFLYASSACVYNGEKQTDPANRGVKESDAYPALAEDGYGWEKATAAICRKVIDAQLTGKKEIIIWGDGHQTRSFMYIDDCIKGIQDIMYSNIHEPINLGSSEMVSINQLVDIVEDPAGPVPPVAAEISVKFEQLGITGTHKVKDLWTGEDLGKFTDEFKQTINRHGAGLYRIIAN